MWQHVYSMDDWDLQTMQAQDDPAEPPYAAYRLWNRFTQQELILLTYEGEAIAHAPVWRKRALIIARVRGNSASWVTGSFAPAL